MAAFPLYGVGSGLLVTESASLGLILVLANSLVVLAIGRILHAIALPYARFVANFYLAARLLEALLLGISGWLVYQDGIADSGALYYRIAMIGLGIASLPLLGLLMRVGRMPAWLGWFGIVGYTVFICGIVADGFGAVEFGLLLVIPGALFEVTFAVWLIVRGFASGSQEAPEPRIQA
ncbi:MAG: DUF4386 family protein [Myxococcota bacterium]|nr:DUF4386 family protein [Myxococcota bacterium]